MDPPPPDGVHTTAEGKSSADGSVKHTTTRAERRPMPGSFVDIPSDDSAKSDHANDSMATTPPKPLSRNNSDFPPTPPTMTSSELADPISAPRRLSPSPVFADRVRNELERHKSGLSTPVNLSNSPPTPDPSPPTRGGDGLTIPRPAMAKYESSYAESFQTATEGRTSQASSAHATMLPAGVESTPKQSWLDMARAMGLSNQVLAMQDEERAVNDTDSDKAARVKNYHLESDGSEGEKDNKTVTYDASDERSTSDSNAKSSPVTRSVSQKLAVTAVPRLRRPFQPGDEIKRPDDFLIYASTGSIKKWKKPERMSRTPPPREMDSEFLRNAEPVFQPAAPEAPESGKDILQRLEDVIKEDNADPAPLTALPPIPAEERQILTPREEEVKPLKEFTPSPPANTIPTPPSTAQKEKSLEENNVVYKMIQEENAKRHSAISDGSVPARVVAPAENKRKLRHSQKRDSLRGDVSLISSSDSHRLRHKRAMGSLGHSEDVASAKENVLSNGRPSTRGTEGKSADPIPRASRSTGEKIFSYSNMRDRSPKVAPASVLGNPHKLRRSLRHSSLDHTPRSVSDSARPLSVNTHAFLAEAEAAPPSPRLRRSSAENRLDRNNEVRRTSLGHVPEVALAPIEPVQPAIAEQPMNDVSKEETQQSPRLGTSERMTRRDRPESSEVSFNTTQSPRRKSMDYRSLHPTITPMSQASGTAMSEAELCEAKGVTFFPHNNKSLLVVQTARHVSIPDYPPIDEDDSDIDGNPIPHIKSPRFKAFVTPADEIGKPLHSVDSPLTNPRAAPEPPVIKFIPPTPADELERELGSEEVRRKENSRPNLQRSLSLKDRIRRLGDALNQPVPFGRQNSYRRSAPPRRIPQAEVQQRPTYLSSFWQPRDFWEGYSDDSDVEDEEDFEPLPAGGDTSDVGEEQQQKRRSAAFFLPRAMSKRLPGFRGSGGFLMGNSLGIDRHGSNNRRHYVERRANASHPSLVLRPDLVPDQHHRQPSSTSSMPSLRNRHSEELLRRLSISGPPQQQRRIIFKVPFTGGRRIEYVGFSVLGKKLAAKKKRAAERQAEERRMRVRESIGPRVYHEGGVRS
ncbi:hypothetical protein CB0940_04425 [Cercospora beticola]|uniref:Uncharacterized protein n=1 Tax=Cercospora beticola TaxID=122368 RepID=A0A2G5HM29_CERBT|nr:hypothetical protein CB0940_04425 [Cercospora beticola]PIA93262.1 hypothetical protein CB0940_04425 [Cercospora beticola]WPB01667.1 hypothetical protein RHO25_006297 [Cercospora beticola]